MLSPHRLSAWYWRNPPRILMQMRQSDRLSYSYTINHKCAVPNISSWWQCFLVSPRKINNGNWTEWSALKSDWLFCFAVPGILIGMRFRAKDSAIREQIAALWANHIARITTDFKMDLIKKLTSLDNSDIHHYVTCCHKCANQKLIGRRNKRFL